MKVKIFHGSRDYFEKVLLYKCCDIGFHCGTLEQALYRIMDIGKCYTETFFKSYVYEININIDNKNCIEFMTCIRLSNLLINKSLISQFQRAAGFLRIHLPV